MTGKNNISNWFLGVIGGVVGGTLGYFAFFFIARQGLYAMVLPGALLGLGCGYLSGIRSTAMGVACGISALILGLFIECQFAPFVRDDSFTFFITHVHDLKSMTLVLIALGGFLGFWFGKGREGGAGFSRGED